MERLAFQYEFLDIALRLGILPTQRALTHDIVKKSAGHDEGSAYLIKVLVAAIACN